MVWISDLWKDFEVLDTSEGGTAGAVGKYLLVRPTPR